METENKQAGLKAPVAQEDDSRLDKKVGDIEPEKLAAVRVKVISVEIKTQRKKQLSDRPGEQTGSIVGDIVNLTCKHPDKEENLVISKVKYEKDGKLKEAGLWYNEDKEGDIQKGSALSTFLSHYACANLKAIEGQEINTAVNDQGYLVAKAY